MATKTKLQHPVTPVDSGPIGQTIEQRKIVGKGPDIWLAGDPEDLIKWMDFGAAGIVTNTVVLNQMVKKYGHIKNVTQMYLDITDKPVVIEIDGSSKEELLRTAGFFYNMSDKIIIKVPCTTDSLGVFNALDRLGVKTYCTTVFSLPQAAAVAQAGATHILPFCEPVRETGGDPTKLIRECVQMFKGWSDRPYISAALVRSVETAYAALRDGADGIIIFWNVYEQMLSHPLTDQWNETFLKEWEEMSEAGLLDGMK